MKKLIAGNWKMNKGSDEAASFAREFRRYAENISFADIVICPPFTLLPIMKKELSGTNIALGAQNMFYEDKGSFTGEISPAMVREFCTYVIIGHSERRQYFNETDDAINRKIKKALSHGLSVIFCIGETLAEREKGLDKQVVASQLRKGLDGISSADAVKITVAYEPVWAIGTGKTASPEQAEDMHRFIRKTIEETYSEKVARETRIIYGGSVKPENARELMSMRNIDGCLPGGASLDPRSLFEIVKAAR